MTNIDDRRMLPALVLAVLLATGCNGNVPATGEATGTTQAAMTADLAPAGTCTEAGSGDTIPCMGLTSGTTVALKVEPPDSGSTSTVPFAKLTAECTDSGSTSTVPCTVYVKGR